MTHTHTRNNFRWNFLPFTLKWCLWISKPAVCRIELTGERWNTLFYYVIDRYMQFTAGWSFLCVFVCLFSVLCLDLSFERFFERVPTFQSGRFYESFGIFTFLPSTFNVNVIHNTFWRCDIAEFLYYTT